MHSGPIRSWVTGAGVGAYQLRVGQPPGSTQPLVALEEHMGHSQEEVDVVLVEARANDPAVPDGKVLARVGGERAQDVCMFVLPLPLLLQPLPPMQSCCACVGDGLPLLHRYVFAPVLPPSDLLPLLPSHLMSSPPAISSADPSCPTCCTYLLNSQSIEALAFRSVAASLCFGKLGQCLPTWPVLTAAVEPPSACCHGVLAAAGARVSAARSS